MVYRKQDFSTVEIDRIFIVDQRQTCALRLDILTTVDWSYDITAGSGKSVLRYVKPQLIPLEYTDLIDQFNHHPQRPALACSGIGHRGILLRRLQGSC